MIPLLKLVNDSLVPAMALVAGGLAFRRFTGFQRWMYLQLAVSFVFLVASYAVLIMQKRSGLQPNNHLVFNLHLPAEALLLCVAAQGRLAPGRLKWLAWWGFMVIAAVYFSGLIRLGIQTYAYHADAAACMVYCLLFGVVVARAFHEPLAWWRNPDVYIGAGVFIYAACSVPYITAFGFLQNHYPRVSELLFHLVSDVLANLRYLLLAIGFWLIKTS